jgi:hypothetical protein
VQCVQETLFVMEIAANGFGGLVGSVYGQIAPEDP